MIKKHFNWVVLGFYFMQCLAVNAQNLDKPNVLFIISDDLAATAVSAYEIPLCQTPHIDQLAAEGMRYTRAYCQFPICGPSRASFLFGYYPSATETYGYESGRKQVENNPYGLKPLRTSNEMKIVKAEGGEMIHTDGKTAAKASELIKAHKEGPFFLAVGFIRPHVPFVAPKSYFEPYPHQQMVLPPKVIGDWDDIPERGINYVNSVDARMSEEQEKKAVAAYYASVTFMDAQVGKVLQTLREEGLEDNTIVIFTSDHGFFLGEHRFWMKVAGMELYDMAYDPKQYNNLAGHPNFKPIVSAMQERLKSKLKEVRDNELKVDYHAENR